MFDFLDMRWLWGLLLAPLFLWFLRRQARVRSERLAALGRKPGSGGALLWLPLLCFVAMVLAIARPYFGFQDVTMPRAGRDLMLVVDVSLSMATKDNSPSRMDFAKRKIRDSIDYIARHSGGDRLGIILFAGESYLFCPLTADYSVLRTFAASVGIGLVSSGGSAITDAVVKAANSFSATRAGSPAVVLFSDGEDDEMVVARSLDILKGFNLKLWALGFGTPEGKPIDVGGGRLIKDSNGNVVVSRLREDNLRMLAEKSGGLYRRAEIGDGDLNAIMESVQRELPLVTDGTTNSIRVYNELGPWLLWIPLVLSTVLVFVGRRAILFALLLALPYGDCFAQQAAAAGARPESLYDARKAYEAGDYKSARDVFAEYAEAQPQDRKIKQALASSEFKLGNFEAASKLFAELAASADSGRERYEAFYDKGTSDLSGRKFQDAIAALDQALQSKPNDIAAAHNRAIAQKLLEEQQRQEQKKDQQQKQQSQKQDEKQKNPKEKSDQQKTQDAKNEDSTPDPENQGAQEKREPGTPGAQGTQPSSSPTPDSSSQNKSAEATPEASPEATSVPSESEGPGSTPSPAENSKAEAGESTVPSGSDSAAPHDPKALKEREAKAWLESLDDSPVLLRRQVGSRRNPRQQTW